MPRYYLDEDGWNHPAPKTRVSSPDSQKLVLRPTDGLNLRDYNPRSLHKALGATAKLSPNEAAHMTVGIDHFKNLAFVLCSDPTASQKLIECPHLLHNGTQHRIRIYAAAARETCRGVIHDVEPGTESGTLLKHIRAPNYEILAARMMGSSTSAIITFEGTYIPTEVIYDGGIYRCRPHRPRAQHCTKCLAIGHRADVCIKVTKPRCPKCGNADKDDDQHTCITKCVNCGGPHSADDNSCELKISADSAVRYQEYHKRIAARAAAAKTTPPTANKTPNPPTKPTQEESKTPAKQRPDPPQAPKKEQARPPHQPTTEKDQPGKSVSQPFPRPPTRINNTKLAQRTYLDALKGRNNTAQDIPAARQRSTPPALETTQAADLEAMHDMDTECSKSPVDEHHRPPGIKRSRRSEDTSPPNTTDSAFDLQVLSRKVQELELKLNTLAASIERIQSKTAEDNRQLADTIISQITKQFEPLTKTVDHLATIIQLKHNG